MKIDEIAACEKLAEIFISSRGEGKLSQLGDGGSAVVFRWEQPTSTRALKVYDPKFLNSDAAPAERHRLTLQRRLIDRHCPSMIDTLAVEEELGTCFVTMEFFPGNELKKVIGEIPDDAVERLIGQLVNAVLFLQDFDLVHRDIKPENILVSSDFSQLKLLDLGVIREISANEDRIDGTDHGHKRPFIATAQYSAPEYLFRLEPPSVALWKALTIYQVGGVLHDLVCKRSLFERAVAADNKYALAMSVMRDPPDFTGISPTVSTWAAVAARCLTKDSALRLQLVDWSDFFRRDEPAKARLKRVLNAVSARSDTDLTEVQAIGLRAARTSRISSSLDELRKQLIAEFSPQLRISQLGADETRTGLYLNLTDISLGVRLAVEYSWESGIREGFAAVRLAANASSEEEKKSAFSGIRRPIGELSTDGTTQPQLVDILFDAISTALVKHFELAETGALTDGADLVALTWPELI